MRAAALMRESAPRSPSAHLIRADGGQLFIPNGSRIFGVDGQTFDHFESLLDSGDEARIEQQLHDLGVDIPPLIDDRPLLSPPLRALSLAVAQKCNLGCTYCYAQQGEFGGAAKAMPLETALSAVDLLFRDVVPGDRVNLSFLGGEPLLNRSTIHAATRHAVKLGSRLDVGVSFSITTNGTLVTPDDNRFRALTPKQVGNCGR